MAVCDVKLIPKFLGKAHSRTGHGAKVPRRRRGSTLQTARDRRPLAFGHGIHRLLFRPRQALSSRPRQPEDPRADGQHHRRPNDDLKKKPAGWADLEPYPRALPPAWRLAPPTSAGADRVGKAE